MSSAAKDVEQMNAHAVLGSPASGSSVIGSCRGAAVSSSSLSIKGLESCQKKGANKADKTAYRLPLAQLLATTFPPLMEMPRTNCISVKKEILIN